MSMSDPTADLLTRVRNACHAKHENVTVPMNKLNEAILSILQLEGFIGSFQRINVGSKPMAKVELKYYKGESVIRGLRRSSKPGRRQYLRWRDIRPTMNNMGLGIMSTPKGVISSKQAKYDHKGGELICIVW